MSGPTNGKSVLVVDDDALTRDVCRAILEGAGFEVTCVADGESGLEAFGAKKFECVVLDIYMPGLTGLDVIEALDPDTTKVPIIAISGGGAKAGTHPLPLAETLGASRSFEKDFDHDEFLQAVRELTGL